MAFHLPLFHRSGSIVFLDDDLDYLDMLGMVLPTHLQVELYMRPATFLERMREEPARWEADAAQHLLMIERWRQGHHLLPQVLRYWANNPARYQLVQTVVVDYAMPGMDGLKVLNTLLDWPGSRILLTGQADEQIAVQAFNGGLIHQFIPKQAADIAGRLLAALAKLGGSPHPRLNTLWRAVLQPAQQSVLQVPSVSNALQQLAQRQWIEYVVLGEPFGVLGLDADGCCQWLQLEPTGALDEPAELAGTAGLGLEVVRAVQNGQLLPAVELHQQLGLRGPIRTAPAFAVGDEGLLTGALFELDRSDLPQPVYAYRNFLDAQTSRSIQDA
jgi:CheY-like chemotaxis protein